MRVGIVGFAGVGKTTIFAALTGLKVGSGVQAQKAHLGVIKVPDPRLEALQNLLKLQKAVHAEITFMDFPWAKKERGLDPAASAQLREADAFALVVRCFSNPADPRPPAPEKEIGDFEAELKLSDLAIIENRLARLRKEKGLDKEKALLEHCRGVIEQDRPLRSLALGEDEEKALGGFGFLSQKPLLVLPNVAEGDIRAPLPGELRDFLAREGLEAVPLSGKLESEAEELEAEERLDFLKEIGIQETARDRFIRSCYRLLNLISFFTHNEEEVRAWSIRKGAVALKAAGKVHSDMERGFIRAEVAHYEDLVRAGSEVKLREAGRLRLEGKDYVVQDGDVIRFRFHV